MAACRLRLVSSIAALVIAGCTAAGEHGPAAARAGRECFLASSVSGFTETSAHSVVVTTGPRQYYRLDTFGQCHDLDYSEVVGVRATGGGPWICSQLEAELVVPSVVGPQRCFVRNLHRLSDAEVSALSSAPKKRK